MSNRFYNYDKGSSRSARDDSRGGRPHDGRVKEKHGEGRLATRSRSRSPRPRHSPEDRSKRHSPNRRRGLDYDDRRRFHDKRDTEEEVPAPPPPPRISKISIDFSKTKVAPIKMSLGGPSKAATAPKPTIASVFNADDDDDDEPEEMPAEARMRMRNIGRETPTSAGPNSFGKTKQGFCDAKKVFEKNMKQALDTVDRSALPKFPQTIYKLKGP